MDIIKTTLIVTVLTFIVATIVYTNPLASKLYQKSTKLGILKAWKNQKLFMLSHFFSLMLEVLFYTLVFSLITIHPASTWVSAGLLFGLFIFLIRIIPRFLDMFVMVNYPMRLLLLELVNGLLINMAAALGISYFLY